MSEGAVMQGMLLFFNELYGFLEFVCVYYSTILGFCAIISVFVLGIIMTLRSTLFSGSTFVKGALWCLLIPVLFCGKLHAFFETRAGVRLFYWWYLLCNRRWICAVYFVGMIVVGTLFVARRIKVWKAANRLFDSKDHASTFVIKEFSGHLSSFCIGCLKPMIIIPEGLEGLEADIVIKHEETHIKLGHLWILLGYDILRVFLWPNVFLHLCVRYLKRDLEEICDAVTLQRNGIDACDYGETIVECAKRISQAGRRNYNESAMSFTWTDGYGFLKKRLKRIVNRRAYNSKMLIGGAALLLVILATMIGVIKANSYKRTNDIGMMSSICYAGNLDKIYTDFDQAVVTDFDDEYIYVDGKALLEKYPEAASEDGWFYFSVGGYYKIPGIGGGGGWGEIDAKEIYEGPVKIKNHTDIDIWNRIIMWL
ncbi:MAG: M56 family metallopeptidase [Butyrivibrio sp.]|nr:M56 family metallopeptidase [Butyrivibrio sp.]